MKIMPLLRRQYTKCQERTRACLATAAAAAAAFIAAAAEADGASDASNASQDAEGGDAADDEEGREEAMVSPNRFFITLCCFVFLPVTLIPWANTATRCN